jgi:brefeldin A-inhibited guanine nucleotide-exchange protein
MSMSMSVCICVYVCAFMRLHQIGTVLGEGSSPFQVALRLDFCRLFEFKDRPFLECLRVFLQSFHLPGESQQIDRM